MRLLLAALLTATAATTPALSSPAGRDVRAADGGVIATPDAGTKARIARILRATPLIDGHNDWPWALRGAYGDARYTVNLATDATAREKPGHTDLPRLRAGQVGAQFWSVYVPAELPPAQAAVTTIEQIDLVRDMIRRAPQDLELARTADDIVRIHAGRPGKTGSDCRAGRPGKAGSDGHAGRPGKAGSDGHAGRVASLIGIEGGYSIANSLGALRQFHELGVRYMTLTHSKTLPWADSATDAPRDPKNPGLSPFGVEVVREMNRLGMLVDISHVSEATMADVLDVAKAPVIFSHSSARALVDHPRNVPDAILKRLPLNGGVVMVTFVPQYVSAKRHAWGLARTAEQARLKAAFPELSQRQDAALADWDRANPNPRSTIADVADHIDHIARVAGHDHVGIGGDYDGIAELPTGLETVATYPALFAELARRGWTDADLAKLAGGNLLCAMRAAESYARAQSNQPVNASVLTPSLPAPPDGD